MLRKFVAALLAWALLLGAPAFAADTNSPILQLLLMGAGLHSNDWGTQTNTNLQTIETAIAGSATISVSGGSLSLSQAQFGSGALVFTGSLLSNETITVLSQPKYWVVKNGTSGNFTLSLKTATGAAVAVPQSATLVHIYWSDGINIVDVSSDGLPVLTSATALANVGAGTQAVSLATLATAMNLGTASTPVFLGLDLSGAAGTLRALHAQTAGADRWVCGGNAAAESGANVGSDFVCNAYADDGVTLLGTWMTITRATGAVNVPGALTIGGSLTVGGKTLTAPAEGFVRNLLIKVTSDTTMEVSADTLTLYDGTNVKVFRNLADTAGGAGSVSTACSNAVQCMDTGSPGNNRWLNVWALGKSDGTAHAILTAAAAPTPPALPAGYTFYQRLGAVRIDLSAKLMRTRQLGKTAEYVVTAATNTANLPIIASGIAGDVNVPTWVPLAVGNYVPPTATHILATLSANAATAMVAPSNAYGAFNSQTNPPPAVVAVVALGSANSQFDLVLESTNIYWASNNVNTFVAARGWVENF